MMNETNISTILLVETAFRKQMRLTNFLLLWTGFIFNLLLTILLFLTGRRQCTTYFLLILMTICDCLYCAVHLSIILTIDHYINIINHQILCPLSFFLTPFTFTGSTLFLLICLLHFITNYVRKYDTILGQIGGRLSVVFVLAFVIIRSVLGSTSVELITLDPNQPDAKYCTIDMNTPEIVETIQNITHVFAEVTDILVYLGWLIIVIIYVINVIRYKNAYFDEQHHSNSYSFSMSKQNPYASLLIFYNNNNKVNDLNQRSSTMTIAVESTEILNAPAGTPSTPITNKHRHRDISLIILSIAFASLLCYAPIMIGKCSTMYLSYFKKPLFNVEKTEFLQILQNLTHSLCLSCRFLPYFLFDRRLHSLLHQMIGMQCMKIEQIRSSSKRKGRKTNHRLVFRCRRRQRILSASPQEQLIEFNRQSTTNGENQLLSQLR